MRLSNVKTRNEVGYDYVVNSLNLLTPFGKKILKELEPFTQGEETLLEEELRRVERLMDATKERPLEVERLLEIFMQIKDCTYTLDRASKNPLSVVELFEVKGLLLLMSQMGELQKQLSAYLCNSFLLEDITGELNALDPNMDRLNTFYIYDEFSLNLKSLRAEKRELELQIRKIRKGMKQAIGNKYGIVLSPKYDYTVSRSNVILVETLKALPEMMLTDQDYVSVTFELKPTDEIYALLGSMEGKEALIEEEELKIRELLSQKISQAGERIKVNCMRIGLLDFSLSKGLYAKEHDCVKPQILREHAIRFTDGRHLRVEDVLKEKGESYCPVSIRLEDGVTCITGANMGGKTVCLKLTGLVAILAQYGFFVPCKEAFVGLSSYVHLLIGDNQSIERGLSSFGSEMEELKEALDHSKDRALLLIDEIASGTNPVEGLALTKGLILYLLKRNYLCLITTHFDSIGTDDKVKNLQVIGLAYADFGRLEKEIKYANRKERIAIIGKYMDYRLEEVHNKQEIPKDAVNIARILGVYDEIIDYAKKML